MHGGRGNWRETPAVGRGTSAISVLGVLLALWLLMRGSADVVLLWIVHLTLARRSCDRGGTSGNRYVDTGVRVVLRRRGLLGGRRGSGPEREGKSPPEFLGAARRKMVGGDRRGFGDFAPSIGSVLYGGGVGGDSFTLPL